MTIEWKGYSLRILRQQRKLVVEIFTDTIVRRPDGLLSYISEDGRPRNTLAFCNACSAFFSKRERAACMRGSSL